MSGSGVTARCNHCQVEAERDARPFPHKIDCPQFDSVAPQPSRQERRRLAAEVKRARRRAKKKLA